jgi:hypothetical protein
VKLILRYVDFVDAIPFQKIIECSLCESSEQLKAHAHDASSVLISNDLTSFLEFIRHQAFSNFSFGEE